MILCCIFFASIILFLTDTKKTEMSRPLEIRETKLNMDFFSQQILFVIRYIRLRHTAIEKNSQSCPNNFLFNVQIQVTCYETRAFEFYLFYANVKLTFVYSSIKTSCHKPILSIRLPHSIWKSLAKQAQCNVVNVFVNRMWQRSFNE